MELKVTKNDETQELTEAEKRTIDEEATADAVVFESIGDEGRGVEEASREAEQGQKEEINKADQHAEEENAEVQGQQGVITEEEIENMPDEQEAKGLDINM